MGNKVSLFIPVFNVAKLIGKNLRKAYDALVQLETDFEIFIVDDNSSDKSYRFKKLIDKIEQTAGKELKYVAYSQGPSRRENLAKSFYLAKYPIICFVDADFSCDISFLLKAIRILEEKSADVVIGSRYISGAKVQRRLFRRFCSFCYNKTIKFLFASKIEDHQCGLKVFRKDKIMPIIDKMGYDNEFVRGWFWDAELLIRAQKANMQIIEIPIKWHFAPVTAFNLKRELRCLKAIVKLKRTLG